MSYQKKIEYRILPAGAYKIRRGCAGCGCRQVFASTGHFRINANGSCLDIWLVYQCENCKHTYNLPIYSRINPKKLRPEEYAEFLSNDPRLAYQYGTKKELFLANHTEIAWDLSEYELIPVSPDTHMYPGEEADITIHNPLSISVRKDKLLANILQVSRSTAKKLLDSGQAAINITI